MIIITSLCWLSTHMYIVLANAEYMNFSFDEHESELENTIVHTWKPKIVWQ